jgi:fucose permease
MIGRIVAGAYADAVGPLRMLRGAVWGALTASLALAIEGAPLWLFSVALATLGFSLAPIYPLAMHDTAHRFDAAHGARVIGYHVAAASLGTATLPWLLGAVAARSSLVVLPGLLVVLAASVAVLELLRRKAVRSGGTR